MDNDFILHLYSRPETIFTIDEVSQLFPKLGSESIRDRLYYFAKKGKILRLRHGIYGKKEYSRFELANKIYKPSYVSLETVLAQAGVVFQYYQTVFAVSYLTRTITVNIDTIQYRHIKKNILTDSFGIEEKNNYFVATPERAFLDAVYIYKNYHFDNLGVLNWGKIDDFKKIYKNKAFEKRIDDYYQLYKNDYGKHQFT